MPTASSSRGRQPTTSARGPAPGARSRIRFCNALFPPQAAVGFFDVAPQLVALLGRHLPRAIGTPLALAVGVTHVVAHALALVVLHLPLRSAVAAAPIRLR